jgi:predicted RNase H-like HicB family nuclease
MQFTGVFQKRGGWYVAWVEEIPGVNTQGRTLAEAQENLKEALKLVIEANRELASRDESGAESPTLRQPISIEI